VTETPTITETGSVTETFTVSPTPTATPSATVTDTRTETPTGTPSYTASPTFSPSLTATGTPTPTPVGSFTVSPTVTRTLPPSTPGKVNTYPNPYIPGGGRMCSIRFDANNAAGVEIWDWAGQKRCTLPLSHVAGFEGFAQWDGRLTDGQTAPPGVYFAVVKTPAGDKACKFTVVWP
jgi:hypothetical protein